MKKTFIVIAAMLLVFGGASFARAGEDGGIVRGKDLVDRGVSCAQLADDDLADVGDYYMEQMHPGALHERMDALLGGEGSESLRQMHILIARRWHCGDAIGLGMMGMMMGSQGIRAGTGAWGMMGSSWNGSAPSIGMMGWGNGVSTGWSIVGWLTTLLVWALLILGVIALVQRIRRK